MRADKLLAAIARLQIASYDETPRRREFIVRDVFP